MDPATVSFWIGIYSASLATVLGLLRCFEFFQDRRLKLHRVVQLTSGEDVGNVIRVTNASKVPANVCYYELVWVKPHPLHRLAPLFRKVEMEEPPVEYDGCDITIEPYSQYALTFTEAYHFDWGKRLKHHIYLKLWIVGRRFQKWMWITGPR